MRKYAWLPLLLASLLFACSDDDSQSDTGVAQDSSSGTDASTGTDASAELVNLSGAVDELSSDSDTPVEGATVTLRDSSPLVEATTDSAGLFSIQVPVDQLLRIEIAKTELLSSIYTISAPSSGIAEAKLGVLDPSAADGIASELELPARDTSKGIVIVTFDLDDRGDTAAGTEKVEISATNDGSFVFDDNDDPALGETLVAGGDDTVVFYNVAVGDATATISGAGCAADMPASITYPVEASKVTWILATCGAL